MIYPTADAWRRASRRNLLFFGMSGLGKTHVSTLLRQTGSWFHYSVDYRIGTRYLGEHIADNFKREAMKVPLLREMLLSDSVRIDANITFHNLAPLSAYLGKPGSPTRGGLPFDEYRKRQDQHRHAEIKALNDTSAFIDRARDIYNLPHFVCDTGGSICEVIDPDDPEDPLMRALSDRLLMVWIKGSDEHTAELVARFDRAPKPMYYHPRFLDRAWTDYRIERGLTEDAVDPDDFIRWTYARALAHRQPRYAAMARHGITLEADDVARLRNEGDLIELIAQHLPQETS